jgi:hypothetical protein
MARSNGPGLAINLVPLSRTHVSAFILLYTCSFAKLVGVKNYPDAAYYLEVTSFIYTRWYPVRCCGNSNKPIIKM